MVMILAWVRRWTRVLGERPIEVNSLGYLTNKDQGFRGPMNIRPQPIDEPVRIGQARGNWEAQNAPLF
jgi:hypothetical protein